MIMAEIGETRLHRLMPDIAEKWRYDDSRNDLMTAWLRTGEEWLHGNG